MKVLVLAVLVASSFISARTQERIMDRSEFDAVVRDDKEQTRMWTGKSYRMSISLSSSISDRPEIDYSSRSIIEHGANGSSRSYINSTFGGKKTETSETIRVGSATYVRTGAEPWKTIEPKNVQTEEKVSGPNLETPGGTHVQTEYRYLAQVEWKGEKVNLYLRTERGTEIDVRDGKSVEKNSTSKYWINSEGLILKAEHRFVRRSHDHTSLTTVAIERESDPGIVVKDPQIESHP